MNNLDFLAFNINDFNGADLRRANISSASATTSRPGSASATTSEPCRRVYTDFVNANGTEIEQD